MKSPLIVPLVSAALVFGATSSFGADISVPEIEPVFSWTGLYVGGEVGFRDLSADVFLPSLALSDAKPSPNDLSIGGEIGYRVQFDNRIVLGLSADAAWLEGNDDFDVLTGFPAYWRAESDWTASVQASLGYAFDRALVYGMGGIAYTDVSGCGTFGVGGPCVAGTQFSGTHKGWTVGAGVAYALTDRWSANIEYHYSDFGSENYSTPGSAGGITKVDLTSHAASFGIQFHF